MTGVAGQIRAHPFIRLKSPLSYSSLCFDLTNLLYCNLFFPKFNTGMLTSFYDITNLFLEENGYAMKECSSEEEAKSLKPGNGLYPVYTFSSDTTGEKLYEEFFTAEEQPDLDKFQSLGVINASHEADGIGDMSLFFSQMKSLMEDPLLEKKAIVQLLEQYIPGFAHNETGKLLDTKM